MTQTRLFLWLSLGLLGLTALIFDPASARAAAGPWVEKDQLRLRLISAGDTAAPDATGRLQLGLEFQMQPGWKIYWRSPGDAGFPPSLDWTGSENLTAAELAWPAPHRFSLFGLETFGYGGEVVLPIAAQIPQAGDAVALTAQVELLTCEEICIPYNETLTLNLPGGSGGLSPEAALIEQYLALVPGDGAAVGLTLESAVLTGDLETPYLEVQVASAGPLVAPDVLVEGPPSFSFGKPEVVLNEDGRSALLRLASARGPLGGVVEGKQLTLTLLDGDRAMEQVVVARYAAGAAPEAVMPQGLGPAAAPPEETSFAGLLKILALALLGGLILNLMPCVLPVLSIKLLSVVKQGGRDRAEVRLSFLASAAGILCSFLVLAALAVGLKSAGLAVGWGIQFQQPVFLAVMALLVTLFACNLFGFFEISLPGWLGSLATSGPHHGVAGHFVTGAFATLLATPCSAPFLGTAIGFALARGAGEIFLIFAVLGLGLALPYLAIAALPRLATAMPRPGAWMVWLRRVLGLALAGTALWLLSVLAAQVSLVVVLGVGLLLAGLGVVLWLRMRWGEPLLGTSRLATPALASLLALGSVLLPLAAGSSAGPISRAADAWPALDRAEIARHVAAGSVVFVDVTADWCITCQVNKKFVLDQDSVSGRLLSPGVVLMRGDWTRPSDEISDYLAGFGRYGIPFNAVYGPGTPEGLPLPELLSVEAVLEALAQAAGG